MSQTQFPYPTKDQIRFENNRRWLFLKAGWNPDENYAGKIAWDDPAVTLYGWRYWLSKKLKIDWYRLRAMLHSDHIEADWARFLELKEIWKGWKRSSAISKGNRTRARKRRQDAIKEGKRLPVRPKKKRSPGRPRRDQWTLEIITQEPDDA